MEKEEKEERIWKYLALKVKDEVICWVRRAWYFLLLGLRAIFPWTFFSQSLSSVKNFHDLFRVIFFEVRCHQDGKRLIRYLRHVLTILNRTKKFHIFFVSLIVMHWERLLKYELFLLPDMCLDRHEYIKRYLGTETGGLKLVSKSFVMEKKVFFLQLWELMSFV